VIWWAVYGVAGVLLLAHARSRNAVWGTATLGLLIGVVIAWIQPGFDWWTVAKTVAIATLVGTLIEWLPRLGRKR